MKLKTIIKILISIIILSFLLFIVDLNELKETILKFKASQIIKLVSLYCLGQIISSFKWWLILKNALIKVTFTKTTISYFSGMFTNFFGLGMATGDFVRGILAGGTENKTKSLITVGIDRIHGLLILAAYSLFFAGITKYTDFSFSKYLNLNISDYLIYILFSFLIFISFPLTAKFGKNIFKNKIKLHKFINLFPNKLSTYIYISIISVIFHSLQIYIYYLITIYLNFEIPLKVLLVVIPVINILSSLPLSWNGVGIREAAILFLLINFDYMTKSQGIALGLSWLMIITISSIIGGIIAIIGLNKEELLKLKSV